MSPQRSFQIMFPYNSYNLLHFPVRDFRGRWAKIPFYVCANRPHHFSKGSLIGTGSSVGGSAPPSDRREGSNCPPCFCGRAIGRFRTLSPSNLRHWLSMISWKSRCLLSLTPPRFRRYRFPIFGFTRPHPTLSSTALKHDCLIARVRYSLLADIYVFAIEYDHRSNYESPLGNNILPCIAVNECYNLFAPFSG